MTNTNTNTNTNKQYEPMYENLAKVVLYMEKHHAEEYELTKLGGIGLIYASKKSTGIDEDGSANFELVLCGGGDGSVSITSRINFNSYGYDSCGNPCADSFDDVLEGATVVKLYTVHQEAMELAEELEKEFDFVKIHPSETIDPHEKRNLLFLEDRLKDELEEIGLEDLSKLVDEYSSAVTGREAERIKREAWEIIRKQDFYWDSGEKHRHLYPMLVEYFGGGVEGDEYKEVEEDE